MLCSSACGGSKPGAAEGLDDAVKNGTESGVLAEAEAEEPVPESFEEIDAEAEKELNREFFDCNAFITLEDMENDILYSSVILNNGKEKECLVPVMRRRDGEQVLADPYRRIVCVEKTDEAGGTLVPYVVRGNEDDNSVLIRYASFIECYDLIAATGWDMETGDAALSAIEEKIKDAALLPRKPDYLGIKDNMLLFRFSGSEDGSWDYAEITEMLALVYKLRNGDQAVYALIMNE